MNSLFINESPHVKSVATFNNEFCVRLLQVLKESQRRNVNYSPFSLSVALIVAKCGSGGSTDEELLRCLKCPSDEDTLVKGYESVLDSYYRSQEDLGEFEIKTVARIYVSECLTFTHLIKNCNFFDTEKIDFSNSKNATENINLFVEEQTKGKIKDIIKPDCLSSSSQLVLVNTLYFKALWLCPFKRESTKMRVFHISKSQKIDVPMMYQSGKSHFFNYGEIRDLDSHVVSLPYQALEGSRFSMILIVPKTIAGLEKVEKGLIRYSPEHILKKLTGKAREVHISLPRFKTSCILPLKHILMQVGLNTIFTPNEANFSRFCDHDPSNGSYPYVSDIFQKTFIEVNEEGTEAATPSTAVEYIDKVCWQPLSIFTLVVDRPFFFMIYDKCTGFILFSGRCVNPLEEDVEISDDQLQSTYKSLCCTV